MKLRQMEVFVAVCECGSISQAAEKLYMTQQGVSRTLKELEDELGAQLLVRTSQGIKPNSIGVYALDECRIILKKTQYMKNHIEQMKSAEQQPLWIGMSFGVLGVLPGDFIQKFSEGNPDIKLIYYDAPDTVIEDRLMRGDFDAALIQGKSQYAALDSQTMFRERVFLCVPRKHMLAGAAELTMDELAGQRFVMFNDTFRIAKDFYNSCKYAGIEPDVFLSSADFNSLRETAAATNSLFIVPEHTVRENDPIYSFIPFPDKYFTWTVNYTIRRDKLITEPMIRFEKEIRNALR